MRKETQEFISEKIKELNAHFGVAHDEIANKLLEDIEDIELDDEAKQTVVERANIQFGVLEDLVNFESYKNKVKLLLPSLLKAEVNTALSAKLETVVQETVTEKEVEISAGPLE